MNAKEELIEWVKEKNPDLYWRFACEDHEEDFGEHFNEELARYDIENISYDDSRGVERNGEYWTVEQVESATANLSFDDDVTKFDKWVAFNIFHADTCKILSDEQIIRVGYEFFFNDKDFIGNKIWHYMKMVRCN